MGSLQFKSRITVEIDDSLNAHGSVGIDFWKVEENGCLTEMFTLSLNDTKQLAKWLLNYLAKNDKH